MKKILASLLLTVVVMPAFAQHHHRHHGGFHHHGKHHVHRYHHNYSWVAPVIIGGAVTYALTRPAPVIVQEPPVIIDHSIITVSPAETCTPWREIQQADGTIVRERTCQR